MTTIKLTLGLLAISLFLSVISYAQKNTSYLQAAIGYSKHGSGDFPGCFVSTDLFSYKKENRFLKYSILSTINSDRVKIIVNDPGGSTQDASVRFTTAGIQLGVSGGYNLLKSSPHSLLLSIGVFGRYQSASNGSDGYALYGPASTGIPTVLVGYQNSTPQHTFAGGGILSLQFNIHTGNAWYLAPVVNIQTDTNGDLIYMGGFGFGRKLQ
jgi:hypothetical protein